MQLVETKTLVSSASTIEFTSIPQDGTDLLVLFSPVGTFDNIGLRFNGSTSNYTFRLLANFGGSTQSYTNTAFSLSAIFGGYIGPSSTPANSALYVPNYSGNAAKVCSVDFVHEANSSTVYSGIAAGLWNDTAAITSLSLVSYLTTPYAAGTMVSLYKITKGSGGATVS
jgi:hypothetical protein